MAIVKLALSGLEGIDHSEVRIGSASVVYDPERLQAQALADRVNAKSEFVASVQSDKPFDQAAWDARELRAKKCAWYRLNC